MSILTGAQCGTVKAAAVAYAIDGFSVIALHGKVPAPGVTWKTHQSTRADVIQVGLWDKRHQLNNVGIVCGDISGNLVVMDCDSLSCCKLFEMNFPHLVDTFTVATGSGKGKHYYFQTDQLPPTTRVLNVAGGNIEMRANGCYVVAPPSIHPTTGDHYRLVVHQPMRRLPDMEAVRAWMLALKPPPAPAAPKAPAQPPMSKTEYGTAALQKEAYRLRGITEGNRNNHINLSAFRMGQLVQRGMVNEADAERELLAAAVAAGTPETEALKTIRSGLGAGKTKPIWR